MLVRCLINLLPYCGRVAAAALAQGSESRKFEYKPCFSYNIAAYPLLPDFQLPTITSVFAAALLLNTFSRSVSLSVHFSVFYRR